MLLAQANSAFMVRRSQETPFRNCSVKEEEIKTGIGH